MKTLNLRGAKAISIWVENCQMRIADYNSRGRYQNREARRMAHSNPFWLVSDENGFEVETVDPVGVVCDVWRTRKCSFVVSILDRNAFFKMPYMDIVTTSRRRPEHLAMVKP